MAAPIMEDYLDDESVTHFSGLRKLLDAAGISYRINPRLVRGLDYYGKTVFEWKTDLLGAQGTICAGGRYDGLVEQHGATSTPAVGFAMGLERLIELCDFDMLSNQHEPHIYLLLSGDKAVERGLLLAEELRDQLPGVRIMTHCGGGSFKSQFKKADKSGAELALVIGDDELRQKQVTVKYLRNDIPQNSVNWSELKGFLASTLTI